MTVSLPACTYGWLRLQERERLAAAERSAAKAAMSPDGVPAKALSPALASMDSLAQDPAAERREAHSGHAAALGGLQPLGEGLDGLPASSLNGSGGALRDGHAGASGNGRARGDGTLRPEMTLNPSAG